MEAGSKKNQQHQVHYYDTGRATEGNIKHPVQRI